MSVRTVDLSYVVSHCELVSTEHKMLAARAGPRRDENLAKAQAAEDIAAHFRDAGETSVPAQQVEDSARQIDPRTYAAYDALVRRLLSEGADEGYAARVAEATYAAELAEARSQAHESIANLASIDPVDAAYDKGLADAVAWHESQALNADRLEAIERVGQRKDKYRQRANRHRLYARRMREDLDAARAIAAARTAAGRDDQPLLPFGSRTRDDEGIPLEVQRMFLRKGEVMDDEGFV